MDFPSHFEQIFQQLNYQRLHGQLCDCVIVVGSRHFKAHRSVLAACSTHFRALFTVADGDASMNMIQLDSEVVTAEAFAALVDMMYTSTLMLGASNVMDVLLAASHLHLNTVVKACKHYLTTRTLPSSAERPALHHQHQQDPQRHRQQQQQTANLTTSATVSAAASGAAASRLQRSFLLQQLGLSLVSSALGGMGEEEEGGAGVTAGAAGEQIAPFPNRRFHKRKPSLGGLSEEGRPRQRARPSAPARALLGGDGGSGDMAEGALLSPDSQRMGDDSKLDASLAALGGGSQEDPQMPSQSDSGRCEGEESGGVRKEEYVEEGDHHGDRVGAKVKSGTEEEEEEVQEEKVVVKREPLSSPEAADETSDVTSDPAEPGGQEEEEEEEEDKVELSPESSDRSFTCEPRPSSGTQLLLGNSLGGGGAATATSGAAGFDSGGKSGFSIYNFLHSKGFSGGPGLVARDNDDEDLPNTTTGEAAAHRFMLGTESGGTPGSSTLRPASLHADGGFGDQALQNPSLFLHPLADPQGGGDGGGLDPFGLDFQRSSLGLHSLVAASRGGQTAAAASLGYPGYRRIAPKMASCVGGVARSTVLQDPSSSSSSSSSSIASLGAPVFLPGDGRATSLPPQLTRASADVLSKCKKALSEHNVLVVEGARKYACRICCKTFLTLTDCKKHIRVHTGEKPYACLKCGKRFSQSSHLYKHSKTTCLRWQNSNMPNALL